MGKKGAEGGKEMEGRTIEKEQRRREDGRVASERRREGGTGGKW